MNKKINIAKFPKNSFIESKAIRILSAFIEDGGKAKTFFSENDKTPNHDNYFELLNNDNTPKKQFLVQIKGTENIQPLTTGKHIGKYKYSIDTKFLNYVKEKVTENPAIYFVVDTTNNKIFWIYLSDEKLMSLDFEGKENITYYFSEKEVCSDIAKFIEELNSIVSKRNQIFLNKTPEEISEIQEAIYYLNNLFDNDLKFIKDMAFPNLWRFGIASSKIFPNEFKMTIGDKTITNNVKSNIFSIYPQEKGLNDSGIREINSFLDGINFFPYVDMTGTSTPRSYINDVISQILKKFFDSPLIIKLLPPKVISEILTGYIINFENTFGIKVGTKLYKIEKSIHLIMKYIMYVLTEDNLSKYEKNLKQNLNLFILKQQKSHISVLIDPFYVIREYECISGFKNFYKNNINEEIKREEPYAILLDYFNRDFIEYIMAIGRAKETSTEKILLIKNKKPIFIFNSKKDKFDEVREYCRTWFKDLQKSYDETYNSIFRDNKYLNSGKYKYEIKKPAIDGIVWCVYKQNNNKFSIEESEISLNPSDIGVLTSFTLINFITDKKTLYNSLKCLIYQGISKALNLKCEGITFGYMQNTIFDI